MKKKKKCIDEDDIKTDLIGAIMQFNHWAGSLKLKVMDEIWGKKDGR